MAGAELAPIIIIKKKKIIKGGGHHGGAWKVAYADFVTAMMAFFMLMWLLGATSEKQRKGIADYFSPTITLSRISGGGDGNFGGDSILTEETLIQNGSGGHANAMTKHTGEASTTEQKELEEVELALTAMTGESMVSDGAFRHIVTRISDIGLSIEFYDIDDEGLFEDGTDRPTDLMLELAEIVVRAFSVVQNDVAISGYTRAQPVVLMDNSVWRLSTSRAEVVRKLLLKSGMDYDRVQRVTGHADRKPATHNPMSTRNNRIEVILLRKGRL